MGLHVYREMRNRKQFFGGAQAEAVEIQKRLPEALKLNVMACLHNGAPVAALGWVTFGSVGLPLISATSREGLRLNASYMLWWKMIEYYKSRGFSAVDLAGVSEKRNPGGFYFKTHIIGKTFHKPDRYLGWFDACSNPLSARLFAALHAVKDRYTAVRRIIAASRA
jgi:lipid II:glycine glycyltransferase (peptidoglycan interpeptide bridge formation enzyme)